MIRFFMNFWGDWFEKTYKLTDYGVLSDCRCIQTDKIQSVFDGADCFDPEGEEHLRGPYGIFLSNYRNVTLSGYTVKNRGNFLH